MISPKSEIHSSQRLKRKHSNQLEFQNKELEQFVYAASHDLKEPLRKIQYFNDYVLKYNEQNLDSNSKDYLKRSIVAAGRMSNLIDNLLGYSKITSKVDAYEQIHLKEVLQEIIVQHKEEIERTNATIDISNLPVITGVTFQIKQLLSNLINNSFKYKHPERDLKIIVLGELVDQTNTKAPFLDPTTRYYKITAMDNGIGFEQQYSKKIFEIFQRLNNVRDTNGSGIGLAICKKIIQNHNGYIDATGILNVGASFFFFLPLIESHFYSIAVD